MRKSKKQHSNKYIDLCLSVTGLKAPHPCFTANVNRLSIYCHRDVFTIIEIHTFFSKHVPVDRKRTSKD